MKFVFVVPATLCLALLCFESLGLGYAQEANQALGIVQLLVNGRPAKLSRDGINRLPSGPRIIAITCGSVEGNDPKIPPMRFRFKLVGYDTDWREFAAQMRIIFSFLDEEGNLSLIHI